MIGNVENFIYDIENCFRIYKKFNKTQHLILWNFIKDLIIESFGSVTVRIYLSSFLYSFFILFSNLFCNNSLMKKELLILKIYQTLLLRMMKNLVEKEEENQHH